ncbi:Transcriptional regulator ADR1 [Madurella mycetomatis]|uniref:Transcriptional regulator ADR1 n=1 Tax=Madurella mycetomatis TaxID=100816 RepID=A0A175VNW2_9PEZI|nr:Transcriptional regulator ADR1 [Madurella mycetomatis]
MLPIQSIEGPAPSNTADENGEIRQQKPKALPCKYCSKRFRRVEHVQRHERTHTKEKPFACAWPRCGKTFGRRDLLVRHEKLVHLNEGSGNKDGNKQRKPSSGGVPAGPVENQVDTEMLGLQQQQPRPPPQPHYPPDAMQPAVVSSLPPDSRLAARAPACNLDLLSDAATHLASGGEVNSMQPAMIQGLAQQPADLTPVKPYHEGMPYGDRGRDQDPAGMSAGYPAQPPPAAYDDYNLFLDDFGTSSHFLPPSLESEPGFGIWSRLGATDLGRGPSKPPSAFPSRFPSLQPDMRDPSDGAARVQEDGIRAPNWRISAMDHTVIKNRLDEFSSVLPNDFVFPSRHTLNRFLEGYISGFHEHLPFLHLPTLSPTDLSPELLLAILAVGAQYRFETNRGHALWYATKAVALEQIRRRHSHEVHGLLPTPAAYSPHSTRPSPSSGFRHSFPSVHQDRPMTQDTHREPYSPNTPQSRLETIQALLLLFSVGLWGAKAILHEALSLQSLLALLVREEGLVAEPNQQTADWETWIRLEAATRTKLVAYCFFNLCSIAYNSPPLLLTSEVHLYLPNPSRLWRAENAWQWQEARQSYPNIEISLQEAFARLLNRPSQAPPSPLTSLGSYVLIHALIQHIFLLKQTSFSSLSPFEIQRSLKLEDVDDINHALRAWSMCFEQHRQIRANELAAQGATAEGFSEGPVAFNSTALLRLAYIRLHTDLSPSRSLETRDHVLIASAFSDAPLLVRSPRLCRAVVQAIHALSMLVKMGVNYVAKTKSLEWSMQHSLCNLECAVLLSKWLLTLAAIGPAEPPPSAEEKNLLEMVRRMLDETEFAVPIDPSLAAGSGHGHHPIHQTSRSMDMPASTDSTKLRQLACAVIRLWAETFKGAHIFEIVRIMAAGLEGYADMMEKPRDRTPLGRIVPNQGLG